MMMLEVAQLPVKPGTSKAFEAAFAQAQPIIASMHGYLGMNSSGALRTMTIACC